MTRREMIVDLHTHTIHSDGDLIPAELVRRAQVAGYQALALTDHVDSSNLEIVVQQTKAAVAALSSGLGMVILVGVEITHVPPAQIPGLIKQARHWGAQLVVVHGETPIEPVAPGTNQAAIIGRADILAHPGLLSLAEARRAKQQGVALELTSRAGHCLTNGHVARMAQQASCILVVNSDAHSPHDLHTPELIRKVVLGAGLPLSAVKQCQMQAWKLCQQVYKKSPGSAVVIPPGASQ